jgi:hypothetical protein
MARRGRRESPLSPGVFTGAREALETRWYGHMTRQRELGAMVTAYGAQREPFHRWLRYPQGFSPELVRLFLREAQGLDLSRSRRELLDPFAGSGTFTIECARQGVRACGVEMLASLAFLASLVGERDFPPPPSIADCDAWPQAADRLQHPLHRAALLYAVGRRHTATGKLHPQAPPLPAAFDEMVRMMTDDLRKPLPFANAVRAGDARRLEHLESGTIGGILTSPPYLARHDYAASLRPYEEVYRHWHPAPAPADQSAEQIPAHAGARLPRTPTPPMPPAIDEACTSLVSAGEKKLAALVGAYFHAMFEVLAECGRVLAPGAPCWMVIGGARLRGVYVPTDTALADAAPAYGLRVHSIRIARNLITVGRKLGRLVNVAPRESILELQKT